MYINNAEKWSCWYYETANGSLRRSKTHYFKNETGAAACGASKPHYAAYDDPYMGTGTCRKCAAIERKENGCTK